MKAQDQASPDAGPILKAYSCPVGIIEGTTARLKENFKGQSDVRITSNPRTAQILVYAPAEVQSQIAESLAGIKDTAVSPTSRGTLAHNPPATTNARTKSISINLQYISGRQLEETLSKMLGNRLTAVTPMELGASSFQLTLSGGTAVRLDIMPQLNRASVYGGVAAVDSFDRLIKTLDSPPRSNNESMQLVSLNNSSISATRRTVEALQSSGEDKTPPAPVATKLYQNPKADLKPKEGPTLLAQAEAGSRENADQNATEAVPAPGESSAEKAAMEIGQIGPVQVEMLEGLEGLIIRGHRKDVEQVVKVIQQIEQLSAKTEPAVEVYKLKYIDCQALATLITPIYEDVYYLRQGSVSITALVKPNAVLIVGRKENVKTAADLVRKLDQPIAPESQFHVFRLKHLSSSSAYNMLNDFYITNNRTGLGTKVIVSEDTRSNSLIVQASPRDMAEVSELIARLDTPTSAAVNVLRVIPLEHSMASDLSSIIQSAISGQTSTTTTAQQRPATGAAAGATAGTAARAGASSSEQRSAVLRFLTVDAKGHKMLESGILSDVSITADSQANSIIVSAPAESIELLEALIHELDNLPLTEAEIKVFTIKNGDATNLQTMLQNLFSTRGTGTTGTTAYMGAGSTGGLSSVALEGEGAMIPVRLAVDTRTNSIIASGSKGDLNTIYAIILRLDGTDVRERENHVFRLKNSPAVTVSSAINQFLTNIRSMETGITSGITPFAQIEQEVIVVPENNSNSLIVSATPRYFKEIKDIIDKLDERPPMVMIQVLIAQVTLTDNEEFGIELGLQDGLLFDRSSAITSATTGSTNVPGIAFNNQSLGNNPNTTNYNQVGSQGISNFGLNRTNSDLGYGGFVFSASSESVSVLLRALKVNQRVEVLSRPQLMTMDNQEAYIQIGATVGMITGSSSNTVGQTNTVTPTQVGLIVQVTPRISPDNVVAMYMQAEKSNLGPESEGTPVTSVNGQLIREPQIPITRVQTTISAQDGQTVILGGLITKDKTDFHRKVPWVGDLPVIGRLFRYDGVVNKREELLIIMTPHVVRTIAEADEIKKLEAARMNWCLGDVVAITGISSLCPRDGDWSVKDTEVIYPDLNPRGEKPSAVEEKPSAIEAIPTPSPVNGQDNNAAPSGSSGAPSEPPRIPQPDTGAMTPKKSFMPADVAAYRKINGQFRPSQSAATPPAVQPATYERSAPQSGAANPYQPYPNNSNAVTPTTYDAPPSYPATQQYYR
ncbi:MAG: secretin N-terminal domain-containing protein [Thermoguttaceae bacterium]